METVVGQFALEYLNNNSLHTDYINYLLHKTTIANLLNHEKQGSQLKIQVVSNLFRGFT